MEGWWDIDIIVSHIGGTHRGPPPGLQKHLPGRHASARCSRHHWRRHQPDETTGAYCGAVNLPDVLILARALMEEAGVGDWELGFDRARRRAGQTDHARRRLTLSRHLMLLYDEAQVRETILHEIAHARVGPQHGHDAVWAAEATRLGATGRRLVDAQAPRLRGRWVGRCPEGHEVDRMRRPGSPVSCSRCAARFSMEHLLSWSLDGDPVPHEEISERYSRLLRLARSQSQEEPAEHSGTVCSRPPTSPINKLSRSSL